MASAIAHCPKCMETLRLGLPLDLTAFSVALETFGASHKERCGVDAVMGEPVKTLTDRNDWLTGGDTGISSLTIYSVMTGECDLTSFGPRPPSDPSDFGRCHRLLGLFPEWRARLSEVAERYQPWAPLVREWDRLTLLYERDEPTGKSTELYQEMKRLISEGEAAYR